MLMKFFSWESVYISALGFRYTELFSCYRNFNQHTLCCSVTNGGTFINNEYCDVYLVTTLEPIPLEAFTLQVRRSNTMIKLCFRSNRINLSCLVTWFFEQRDVWHAWAC